ncbi:hypothetical protein DV515_00019381, partial [Chloebia gouldiae]
LLWVIPVGWGEGVGGISFPSPCAAVVWLVINSLPVPRLGLLSPWRCSGRDLSRSFSALPGLASANERMRWTRVSQSERAGLMTRQLPGSPAAPRAPHLDSTRALFSPPPPRQGNLGRGGGRCQTLPSAGHGACGDSWDPAGGTGASLPGDAELPGEREGKCWDSGERKGNGEVGSPNMLGGAGDWGALGKGEENTERGGKEELGPWEERSLGGRVALGLQSGGCLGTLGYSGLLQGAPPELCPAHAGLFQEMVTSSCHFINGTEWVRLVQRNTYKRDVGLYVGDASSGEKVAGYWNSNLEWMEHRLAVVDRHCQHKYKRVPSGPALAMTLEPLKTSLGIASEHPDQLIDSGGSPSPSQSLPVSSQSLPGSPESLPFPAADPSLSPDSPRAHPTVSILLEPWSTQPNPGHLLCSVMDFYPAHIQLRWFQGQQEHSVVATNVVPNEEWTHQLLVLLETPPLPGRGHPQLPVHPEPALGYSPAPTALGTGGGTAGLGGALGCAGTNWEGGIQGLEGLRRGLEDTGEDGMGSWGMFGGIGESLEDLEGDWGWKSRGWDEVGCAGKRLGGVWVRTGRGFGGLGWAGGNWEGAWMDGTGSTGEVTVEQNWSHWDGGTGRVTVCLASPEMEKIPLLRIIMNLKVRGLSGKNMGAGRAGVGGALGVSGNRGATYPLRALQIPVIAGLAQEQKTVARVLG